MMYWYTLKIGDFFLAPRPSILVEEPDNFVALLDDDAAGCGCITLATKKQFTFKLSLIGNGSLATAWSTRRKIELALTSCDNLLLQRRVQDEPWQIYRIKKASLRDIEPWTQLDCNRVLTLEMILTLGSTDNPILTIYEQATFPKLPVFLDFNPSIDVAIHEEAKFPEPTDIFV